MNVYTPTRFYFDQLPSSVLTHIATFLGASKYSNDTLNFAFSSMAAQQAVREALQGTLVTSHHGFTTSQVWKLVFSTGLLKLVINDNLADHAFAYDLLTDKMVNKQFLHTVDISGPAPADLYIAIAGAPVRTLSIEPYQLYGDPALMFMLRTLDLVELNIRCSSRPCIFTWADRDPSEFRIFRQTLRTTLSNLKKISVTCSCPSYGPETWKEMSEVILSIRKPREVYVASNSQTLDKIYCRLPRIPKIEFCLVGDSSETTKMIPSCWLLIRKVDIKRAQFQDVASLQALLGVKEIKLEIMDGAETDLVNLPWGHTETLHIGGSPAASTSRDTFYYKLQHDAIFKAVVLTKVLCDVSIVHCKVDRVEICAILRHLGWRLKRFETSMLGQNECPSQRVLDLMNAMMAFNVNLEKFEITDSVDSEFARKMTSGTESVETYWFLYHHLYNARTLLHRRLPYLDPVPLVNVIQSLCPN